MPMNLCVAGAMIAALTFYALLAGADYGGGVWDLLAFGRRAKAQRDLIAHAIGPVWETNHVWLILLVVLLFVGFPMAYAALATALHIPLTLALIGIVLRGAAFTFRTYDSQRDDVQRRWSRLFSYASLVTPVLLGVTLGAMASGKITVENDIVTSGYVLSWLAPFPFAVGFFVLVLFAFLAAVYLTLETNDPELQDDFRKRALAAGVVSGIMAALVFVLSAEGAPKVRAGLTASYFAIPLHGLTALCALGAFYTLWKRQYSAARILVAAQISLILWGWALAQYPCIIEPNITIDSAAAPPAMLRLLLIALAAGSIVLFPSIYYLFRIFKSEVTAVEEH